MSNSNHVCEGLFSLPTPGSAGPCLLLYLHFLMLVMQNLHDKTVTDINMKINHSIELCFRHNFGRE